MSRYFIDRPIFAWVIAIVLMMAGAIAIRSLPISQFPEIAPPTVTISATYPGADAETLERTTTQIIEQQLKGIDNLRYFSAQSSSAGREIGRASCRERVSQYGLDLGGRRIIKQKKKIK